jgi:hypothetical protein
VDVQEVKLAGYNSADLDLQRGVSQLIVGAVDEGAACRTAGGQNAALVHEIATENCHMERAGGPLKIRGGGPAGKKFDLGRAERTAFEA